MDFNLKDELRVELVMHRFIIQTHAKQVKKVNEKEII
jgi:hypothetical protein